MCSFKFSLVTVILLVSQHGTLAQVIAFRGSASGGGLFGGPDGESGGAGDLSTGELPAAGYAGESNGYLPPLGSSPSSDVPAFARPPQEPQDNSGRDDSPTNQNPAFARPPQPEVPVVRTPPQVGCAAALICVEEQYCTITGIISDTPVSLTENQKLRQVPMVDCKNPDNGVIGKCCRDPNYVDPWPAGNLPINYSGGFDEQGFPTFLNLSKTKPKLPLRPVQTPRPLQPTKGFSQQPTNALPQPGVFPQPGKAIPQKPVNPFFQPQRPSVILQPQQPIKTFPQPQQPSVQPLPQQPQTFQSIDTFVGNLQSQPTFESKKVLPQQPRPFQPPQVVSQQPQIVEQSKFEPQQPQAPELIHVPEQPEVPVQPQVQYQPEVLVIPELSQESPQPQQPQQPIKFSQPTIIVEPPRPDVISQTFKPEIIPQQPQPAKFGEEIQGGKTFNFPNIPAFQDIPNQITSLNPFKPQGPAIAQLEGENQATASPADVPVEFEVTTKKPGIFSDFPNFPSIPGFGKGSEYAPTNNVPIIAPHTPGSQCGIVNEVQYAGNLKNIEVPFGTIPWQAMILSNSQKKLLCSGAVVAPNLVMTTAHCVYGISPSDISIKVGEWKLGYELKHEEPLPFEIVQVESVVAHPNYQPGAAGFDTALLFLEHSVKLDQHVDTICVPDQAPAVTPQRKCISVGWGKTILQLHAAGALMHKIDVDVLSHEQCEQRLQGAESPLELHDSLVCTKAHKQSDNMCMVDVGGPLACDRGDGIYELVGVYSQDTGCLPTNQVATFALMDVKWVNAIVGSASAPVPAQVDYNREPIEQPQQPQQPNRVYYPSNLPSGANQYLPPV